MATRKKTKNKPINEPKKTEALERSKEKESVIKTFGLMAVCIFIVFSFVYQSVQKAYLTYEIANLNKEISDLNIKLMEAGVENERLQSSENVEKIASEKLGMSYEKSDKVIVIKETADKIDATRDEDGTKIKIFMQSLYNETLSQLKQFDITKIKNFFVLE